jgi:uncharacterized protein (DUF302 family)
MRYVTFSQILSHIFDLGKRLYSHVIKFEISMIHNLEKTVIRSSFEAVIEQLKNELGKQGFECDAVTDFQKINSVSDEVAGRKCVVLSVYIPSLYRDMLLYSPLTGLVLPCMISVVEVSPGIVEILPYNATEVIMQSIENPRLQNFAYEVSHRLSVAISALEKLQIGDPDLVTSWG